MSDTNTIIFYFSSKCAYELKLVQNSTGRVWMWTSEVELLSSLETHDLHSSKHLALICHPNSNHSRVEVRHFQSRLELSFSTICSHILLNSAVPHITRSSSTDFKSVTDSQTANINFKTTSYLYDPNIFMY